MRRCIVFLMVMLFICACGGGGGGSSSGSTTNNNSSTGGNAGGDTGNTGGSTDPGTIPGPTQPTTAVITLSTQGTLPPETAISGISLTISVPPGVLLATNESGGVAGDVITGSGQTASKLAITSDLTPSTATTYGALRIVVASTDSAGFGIGDFATVACSVAAGSFPEAAGFQTTEFKAFDLRGMPIATVSSALTAVIQ